jgi:pyridoxamine 5'-phosphate oxidase
MVLELHRADLLPDPIEQLQRWLRAAKDSVNPEPTAMTLATVDAEGRPATRVVLLKEIAPEGLVFFTNYESAKARQLDHNPWCALNFFWPETDRQAGMRGRATKVAREESEAYFATRPRDHRIGAWTSAQSRPVADRAALEARQHEVEARFGDGEIPCPPHWGGFRVAPHEAWFWQRRPGRLHDRFRYTMLPDRTWRIERLNP